MAYINKELDGNLRSFILLFTGLDPSASLALPNAFAVLNLFTEKAGRPSIPSNFFPMTFLNGLEMMYNRSFDRTRTRGTTYIVGVNLVFKSLQDLGAHLVESANRSHNIDVKNHTEHLYLTAVYDLLINFQTDQERSFILAGFFRDSRLPNLEFINAQKNEFAANNNPVIEQRMTNELVVQPIVNTIINARYNLDDPTFDITTAEITKQQNYKRIISDIFFTDPNVSQTTKNLVERKENDLYYSTLNNQSDSAAPEAILKAINTVIRNFNQLVIEVTNELTSQEAEIISKEKELEDQVESLDDEESSEISPANGTPEYQEQVNSTKLEVQSVIDTRIQKRPNENSPLIVNARNALKTNDLATLKKVLKTLRMSLSIITKNDTAFRERRKSSFQNGGSNSSENEDSSSQSYESESSFQRDNFQPFGLNFNLELKDFENYNFNIENLNKNNFQTKDDLPTLNAFINFLFVLRKSEFVNTKNDKFENSKIKDFNDLDTKQGKKKIINSLISSIRTLRRNQKPKTN